MKLRAVLNRRREVLELLGDAITLSDCREAVHRKFGLRTDSFNLSLNGQDVLDNESVLLADLGIVNGDLIYVLQNTGLQRTEEASQNTPGPSRNNLPTNQQLSRHSVEHARDLVQQSSASSSQKEPHDTRRGKHEATKSETEQIQRYSSGSMSLLRSPVLLCREGIPQTLKDMYKASDVGTIHEAAWVVIHVLMLETGYICASEDSVEKTENEDSTKVVPCKDWKKGGIAKIMYTHSSCPGLTCSLTCTSLGPYIMVHGLADSVSKSDVYHCKLQPTDFVRGNVDLKTNGASSVYYNLHRLSRLFKDQVAYPLLSFMRAALGLPQLCGLMAVPAEVKLIILGSLPVHSILNVSCTCRELRSLSNDSTLWQHLVFRDFGARVKEETKSWKMTYIQLYKQRQTQEQLRMQVMVPPDDLFPPGYGVGSHPFRGDPYPPGIIGGHSDLFPNLPFIPGGINPTPGAAPGPGLPRPRFDPFGPLPDINQMPGPSRRGRRSDPSGNFRPGFL
ncbi:hypothetical protein ACROYT_G034143 [Oculina patagonica]